ncbi:hypothetical protein DU002_14420 [Corallincola holothuriorum]|uniref:Uncharacterized protein n=1 Tax=Corallincola holothuriorum TaxID=2282215 RepID=A0A368N7X5_9GAMM|nr:hypothetical protein [Corallincola holothuriorum]RCU45654.1 hypothetical protein DU002_14420 [Corallincola holothuriorum]
MASQNICSALILISLLSACSGKPKAELPQATLNYEALDDGSIKFVYTLPFTTPTLNTKKKRQQPQGGQYRSLREPQSPVNAALTGITDPEMEEQAEVGLDSALDEQELCFESLTIKQRRWTTAGYQLTGFCR